MEVQRDDGDLLELRNVTVTAGRSSSKIILNYVSLSLAPREIVGVVSAEQVRQDRALEDRRQLAGAAAGDAIRRGAVRRT